MLEHAERRMTRFRERLGQEGIPLAILTDEGSIAYLGGFWGYLGVEFGRPTMLLVRPDADPVVVTPLMESEMVSRMTWIDDVRPWTDAGARSWQRVLIEAIGLSPFSIAIERGRCPSVVQDFLAERWPEVVLDDVAPILGRLRMVKGPEETEVMRQAGRIAGAMMKAAHESLAEGVPEYESALAVMAAGTRAAAGFLTRAGCDAFISPVIHGLPILQSGKDTSMVHRRASIRRYTSGDPVYFCFCNLIDFRHYKLGFDRLFHVGMVAEEAAQVQEAAIAAQAAAIAAIRPGIRAEDVAFAADAVYAARGYRTGYRTGRSIGVSWLEAPELKAGDRTILEPGMTFAVDGGISAEGCGGRIGDSVVVTETGCEFLTEYPRELMVV